MADDNQKTTQGGQQATQQQTEVASLSDKISKLESGFQSMQDKLSSVDTLMQSTTRILEVLDIGTDEGFKSHVLEGANASAQNRALLFQNAKRAIDSYLTHESDGDRVKHDHDVEDLDTKRKINQDYFARLNDQRTVSLIAQLQAVSNADFGPEQLTAIITASAQAAKDIREAQPR